MTANAETCARDSGRETAADIAGARRIWTATFRDSGLDAPALDARILIGHALGLDHAALAASGGRGLSPAEQQAIARLAQRRLAGEPVARIVGVKEFWSLPLRVTAATLVPRPETETVVEAALAAVDAAGRRDRPLRIADIGTGSGAILLALLRELPNACGVGTDASFAALSVARDNAERLVPRRAAFVACDIVAALRGPFDLVVSNPPYIPGPAIETLPVEVRLFDPRGALDGGGDGLDCYRAIAATVPSLLASEGLVAVELGIGQAEPVADLFARAGLAPAPPRHDLNGVPRALVCEKVTR
jgi:release factor glutamine methyltransferase